MPYHQGPPLRRPLVLLFITMIPRAERIELEKILPLRALFLQEANCQIRYNACHERGWTDSYLLTVDEAAAGYGSIKGREIADRDTVFEFFVVPPFRKHSILLFGQLLAAAQPQWIECQSNDPLLPSMLFQFAHSISADTVLFEDSCVTDLSVPGATVRRRCPADQVFAHGVEPVGDFVAELDGAVVATGGFLLHYNHPFADLYMEVREDCRRRGIASFLLQEIKRECYLAGRVPAARCGKENAGSRGALVEAGMRICGYMLTGVLRTTEQ